MKALYISVAREFKLIFRNGISLYMAVGPALLAIVFIMVFGAAQNTSLRLIADASVSPEMVSRLEQIADVERSDSIEEMKNRIEGPDSIAGIAVENGSVKLYIEGNEGEDFANSIKTLAGMALGSEVPSYNSKAVEPKESLAYSISMISVLLLSLFIGGATVGLSIVSERESGVIRAVAVSPLRLFGYVVTKLVPSTILCVVSIALSVSIMGKLHMLPGLLLLALCSVFSSGFIIFILGSLATNLISAIGVLKLLMPLSLILPISARFVPEGWKFAYYVFPMYWQYSVIEAANNAGEVIHLCLMTLAVSIPWFMGAVLLFAQKTKLKIWR